MFLMQDMEMDHVGILRRTPPLPRRNPNRHSYQYEKPLPPVSHVLSQFETELLPKPLFCRRMTLPTNGIHVTTTELSPQRSPSVSSFTVSSPASSVRSSIVSNGSSPSTPATSVPSSPTSRTRSWTNSLPPSAWIVPPVTPQPPHQPLRRKKSPRKESLRSLRAKDSDACLQLVYDQRLSAYMNGSMFRCTRLSSGLRVVTEV